MPTCSWCGEAWKDAHPDLPGAEIWCGECDRSHEHAHLCQPGFRSLSGMMALYERLALIPTSTVADTVLIRSHLAYWTGAKAAYQAKIKPSRGHSYRVTCQWRTVIVRIVDHYDHREGVTGWMS
jgi:hypothetical protein